MRIYQILERAADVVSDGWAHGRTISYKVEVGPDGSHLVVAGLCVVAAIYFAEIGLDTMSVGTEELELPAVKALASFLGQNPLAWNDAEGRTQSEVVAALRLCAARWRDVEGRSVMTFVMPPVRTLVMPIPLDAIAPPVKKPLPVEITNLLDTSLPLIEDHVPAKETAECRELETLST